MWGSVCGMLCGIQYTGRISVYRIRYSDICIEVWRPSNEPTKKPSVLALNTEGQRNLRELLICGVEAQSIPQRLGKGGSLEHLADAPGSFTSGPFPQVSKAGL